MSRTKRRRNGSPQISTAARSTPGGLTLGDLSGQETGPLDASFTYFGATIRVNPDMTEVDMIDFLDQANTIDEKDPQSMLMVKTAIRAHVHPDDFDTFWSLRREHRQGVQAVMGTLWQILGGITGKANGRPSVSSDGRPGISPNSPDASSTPDADQSLRESFLRQIDRFEAQGPGGVALAAQVATVAQSKGIDVSRPDRLPALTG